MEYIISKERIQHISNKAYRAGKGGVEVFTQVGADGGELIRCRDCKRMDEIQLETNQPCSTDPNGFCAWAERSDD